MFFHHHSLTIIINHLLTISNHILREIPILSMPKIHQNPGPPGAAIKVQVSAAEFSLTPWPERPQGCRWGSIAVGELYESIWIYMNLYESVWYRDDEQPWKIGLDGGFTTKNGASTRLHDLEKGIYSQQNIHHGGSASKRLEINWDAYSSCFSVCSYPRFFHFTHIANPWPSFASVRSSKFRGILRRQSFQDSHITNGKIIL